MNFQQAIDRNFWFLVFVFDGSCNKEEVLTKYKFNLVKENLCKNV